MLQLSRAKVRKTKQKLNNLQIVLQMNHPKMKIPKQKCKTALLREPTTVLPRKFKTALLKVRQRKAIILLANKRKPKRQGSVQKALKR